MVVCPRCGKENQAHYKFCLGCGGELGGKDPTGPKAPRPAGGGDPLGLGAFLEKERAAPAKPVAPPPPAPVPKPGASADAPPPRSAPRQAAKPVAGSALESTSGSAPPEKWRDIATNPGAATAPAGPGSLFSRPATSPAPAAPVAAPAPAAAAGPQMRPCAKCGTPAPVDFVFCGACGARIDGGSASPTGQKPVVQTMYMGQQATANTPRGKLVLIRPDGTEGGSHPLNEGENRVGRGQGLLFDGDSYLSPQHAVFVVEGGRVVVRDEGSLNGVFLKLRREAELAPGDIFRVGQELIRFDQITGPRTLPDGTEVMGSPNPGFWGRLTVIVGRGVDGNSYPLLGPQVVLGRERGDVLFSDDGYVSGTHARVSVRDGRAVLTDLGSSNGTFLRITQEMALSPGDFLLMGQQLFRVDYA